MKSGVSNDPIVQKIDFSGHNEGNSRFHSIAQSLNICGKKSIFRPGFFIGTDKAGI
jgi:hypothetical protein